MIGSFDAIVALAGGLDSKDQLLPRNFERLDLAIELFDLDVAEHVIVSGGWSLLNMQPAQTEAQQMKAYLLEQGVPAEAIFVEERSHDTIGQAALVKTGLLRPHSWHKVMLVTSATHLRRSWEIFQHVLGTGYQLDGRAAVEQAGLYEETWETLGRFALKALLRGTAPGDDQAILRRLSRIPGYRTTPLPGEESLKSVWQFIKQATGAKS